MRACALISDSFFHLLDHLAPLCFYLDVPLLVDHELTYELAKKYYPQVSTTLTKFSVEHLAENYDLFLVSTKTAARELKEAFSAFGHPDKRFCFCPHGQSDKGLKDPLMLIVIFQDIALLYGNRQNILLDQLATRRTLSHTLIMGNVRRHFYLEHKDFYDDIVQKEVLNMFSIPRNLLFYAPTWSDLENNSSFTKQLNNVCKLADEKYNVIVKLHPFLERDHPAHANYLFELCKEHSHIKVLYDFPLIYPLLDHVDVFLGDGSSLNYDFLYSRAKLFFLTEHPVPIHKAGKVIAYPSEILNEEISLSDADFEKRKKMREDAFCEKTSPYMLKAELQKLL